MYTVCRHLAPWTRKGGFVRPVPRGAGARLFAWIGAGAAMRTYLEESENFEWKWEESAMVMGLPILAFLAFLIQPIIIVLCILYAINYRKLVKHYPFNYFDRLQRDVDKDEK